MKKVFLMMVIPLVAFGLEASQIATWIESPSVTVRDAVWLVESLEESTVTMEKISWKKYEGLKPEERLTAGKLAKILIMAGKIQPGLLYRLTKWERYALQAAKQAGLVGSEVVVGMPLTGAEMVAIVGKFQ
ncbi:hypothetical protein BREVNS_1696 [Brevinematales bacterium NS]|nr:hypothetical protein BREVNS_1696 [Brevinematales bacterium NS]